MHFVSGSVLSRLVFPFCVALLAACAGSTGACWAQSPAASALSPQPSPPPVATSAPAARRFDDWEVVCDPTPRPDACKAVQRLAAPGDASGSRVVFAASALRAAKGGELVMVLSAPLGGYLIPGMAMKVDGRPLARLLFETCEAGGCHGGFVLTPGFRRALERGKALQVRLWTTKTQPADVVVSLKGLGPALAALQAGR
jgi:invasion protein IalB